MGSTDTNDGNGGEGRGGEELEDAHVVELPSSPAGSESVPEDHISPLLTQPDKPKINIFSVSYPRRKTNKEHGTRITESETSCFRQFTLWAWSGSRYSGLLCMALSSSVYCVMEVIADVFSAQAIPLFEIALTRCVIISVLSFLWLRRSGEPIFGPANIRNLFVSRAVTGCISLLTFIYCIQSLPLSQAMILSFTIPILASIAATFILQEKLKLAEMAGIAFSFFGVIFIFRSTFSIQGRSAKVGGVRDSDIHGIYHVYAVLGGLVSSMTGGVSYCLVRAGAKPSDQPVGTIFSFGLLSTPAAAICMIIFEEFVLPSFHSLFLMIVLGVCAFFAELFMARGLQLEKTSKAANMQYLEVALCELWGVASSRVAPTFGRLMGCVVIVASACCTVYLGPEKDME